LLADEVGLGKTIEAGLILLRLQQQNLVNKALILVPEALCVQWFVELLRGFSSHGILVTDETTFDDNRIYIAAHHQLATHTQAILDTGWDIVIIDEAHHFNLTEDTTLTGNLRQLASATPHLLLLSATPERLGLLPHFLRLQLLDPDKFYAFETFQQEAQRYQALAEDLHQLVSTTDAVQATLSPSQRETIEQHFGLQLSDTLSRSATIELLLDSHGTGRTVFRNTRSAIPGFPQRRLITHDLRGTGSTPQPTDLAQPSWHRQTWLAEFVKQHRQQKTLLIAQRKQDILALKTWLFRNVGIDCPVFHEQMSLVERDRAAAFFADNESGAPLLLCSEIGSEGRNFQFCQRLICWDLPEHPDVLEQRIGRLDRIGQTGDIEIHVCINTPAEAARLRWFHDILNAIEWCNPAAGRIHDQWYERYANNPEQEEPNIRQALYALTQELEQGRDTLLELNSCRQPQANELVRAIEMQAQVLHPQELLEKIADVLNIHYEPLAPEIYHIVPSDQMLVPFIPGLTTEGAQITFDRATACSREDVAFVTWEHPLIQGLVEMISLSDLGVASIAILPSKRLAPGTLFAEALYDITIQSDQSDQIQRYLAAAVLRVVATPNTESNIAASLPAQQLTKVVQRADKAIERALLREGASNITALIEKTQQFANEELAGIIEQSLVALRETKTLEITRLTTLQHHNSHITDAQIDELRAHYTKLEEQITQACQPTLSAIRLIVTNTQ
jgi:ATP-dependent helicase HepA